MAKLKPEPRFARRKVRLTADEFASLKEVGTRPMQRTIPDAHRDRLVAVGYVRAIVPYSGGVSALVTGAGLKRLEAGKERPERIPKIRVKKSPLALVPDAP